MKYLNLALSLVLLCPRGGLSQDGVPNLSGVWRWNQQKSPSHSEHPPQDMRVKIEQNGSDITIIFRARNNAHR